MADSLENILVDFDYNNITVIDPNKVIDEFGKAKERLIKHENMVTYANLECKVLPRSKLLVGASNADNLRTISTTDINFLNPGFKSYLTTNWTDEITGKNTITGEGVNQRKLNVRELVRPDKSSKFFHSQSTFSQVDGQTMSSSVDTGMLGIKTIQIQYGSDFVPIITMKLEDVKGRTLFEAGNDSPYSAFFNLPYPVFYLTLKGYYGKAIKLPLQLQDFTCSYNESTSNFDIDLKFYTYKFTILAEVNFASMLAVPYMYKKNIEQTQTSNQGNGNSTQKTVEVFYGYQKVKELYSEYKSKGLIPKEFPELTIQQLKNKLDNFIKDVLDTFIKTNLDPITNIQEYIDNIDEYQKQVFYYNSGTQKSWHNTYNDKKTVFVLSKDNRKIYPYVPEVLVLDAKKTTAENDLKSRITEFNDKLAKNKTLGKNGFYEINGEKISSEIQNTIQFKDFYFNFADLTTKDLNIIETYKNISGGTNPTQPEISSIIALFEQTRGFSKYEEEDKISKVWYFDGVGSFIEKTNKMIKEAEIKKDEISEKLTKALFEIIKNDKSGLGFIPTIRNVTAVLFANIEAYIRLLDEVHTKAWEKRDSSVRKNAICSINVAGANPDVKTTSLQGSNDKTPIYPWPEFLIETSGQNGEEKFQPRYPNDESVRAQTGADNWDEWPEVEFVEEYVNGLTKRKGNITPTAALNQVLDSQRLSVNAIEFPANNQIFNNLEEVKYFFEIYERLIVSSFYSKFSRSAINNNDLDKIAVAISESEKLNIIDSLRNESYFLSYKLKNFKFNQSNFLPTLQHFSNGGVGQSWQNFIRGIFNTSYLKNDIENDSYSIFYEKYNPKNVLGQNINAYNISNLVSFDSEKNISNYLTGSTSIKKFDLTDVFPFTDEDWCRKNLPGTNPIVPSSVNFVNITNNTSPVSEFYDTTKSLFYNTVLKTVTNYTIPGEVGKPITNYNFKNSESDYFNISNPYNTTSFINNLSFLDKFYQARSENYTVQYPTEGNLNYGSRPGILTEKQTVSIFNTPYFINSIQKGVQKFRAFDKYPYLVPAYLFLNSLPFSTLRDRFTKFSQSSSPNSTQQIQSVEQLNYIFPTFRKFGAIHQLPYGWILKMGSVWHRYKKWVETGVDILDECWKGFDYIGNFDPDTSASTKTYSLTLSGGQNVDITLEKETIIGQQVYTQINTGFYPQLINDFNVFLQGYNIINPYITVKGTGFFTGDTAGGSGGECNITNIQSNILGVNTLIKGPGIVSGTIITGQTSGTVGGIGVYKLNIPQTAGTIDFTATNFTQPGYTSTVIQDGIALGLEILNSPNSNYTMNFSGDSSNLKRYIQMNAWTVYAKDTNGRDCYILPSHGALLNQASIECFENGKKKFEVSGNTSIYNGSVRTFWNAPNYGFFDENRILKPKPDEYMKTVFGGFIQQENFSLNNNSSKYTKMGELLTAFDKKVLDEFEQLFLSFSQDKYSYVEKNKQAEYFETTSSNFHLLYTEMMRLSLPPTGLTQTDTIFDLQKRQATNIVDKIGMFMNYNVYFKYGNPSNYDKLTYELFSNRIIENGFNYERYYTTTRNALPDGVNGQTLINSKLEYDIEWKTLLTHVGFSEIPGIRYSDNGSTIFDFFIDFDVAFNEENIILFSQIIKMYATQKKRNSSVDAAVFSSYMDKYLNDGDLLINKTLDNLFIQLQKDIVPIKVTNSRETNPTLQGEQSKLELYQTFKATNDKWISGNDYNRKTLLEDILFLDRANRDLGQKVIVDIIDFANQINPNLIRANSNALDIMNNITIANKFQSLYIPGYVNYYGIEEVSANATPKPEGTLDLANTLFGTFTNVDYRESSTKMVNLYGGAPSIHLDKEGMLEGFKNDSFDLRRATDNPLVENQVNKVDWATSNKVVGFNVDVGPQNQGVFKSFQVSQKNSTPTAEGLQIISEMTRQAGNRGFSTQNLSLYDLYKIRSYECEVRMLGNVLIQPLMYFNLRYVPMFSGPYMITNVSHSVSAGEFLTTFKGVRQPISNLSTDVGLLQSLKNNLVDSVLKDKLKENKDQKEYNKNPDNIKKKDQVVFQATQSLSTSAAMTCTADTAYLTYNQVTNASTYDDVSTSDLVKKIESIAKNKGITGAKYDKLKYSIFAKIWLENKGQLIGQNAKGIERNFSGVELTKNWNSASSFFEKKFFCAQRNSTEGPKPFAVFDSVDKNIEFLYEIWNSLSSKITNVNDNNQIATLILTKNYESKTWNSISEPQKNEIILSIEASKRVFDDNDSV